MDSSKMKLVSKDIAKALQLVLKQHGIGLSEAVFGTDGEELIIKLSFAGQNTAAVSSNAIARYKAAKPALYLPTLGTLVKIQGVQYAIAGLSSDGKRIKATRADTGNKAHDLPLADVLQAIALAAGAALADLAAKDEVQSVDDAAAVLANVCKKAG